MSLIYICNPNNKIMQLTYACVDDLCNKPLEAKWCIYASVNSVIIGSYNGLWTIRCQTFIPTKRWHIVNWFLETNFSGIRIKIFSLAEFNLKRSSTRWQQFCLQMAKMCPLWCAMRMNTNIELQHSLSYDTFYVRNQGLLMLTWFNFNPSMDK